MTECRFCKGNIGSIDPVTLSLSYAVDSKLLTCRSCGSSYFSPMPSDDEISTCYAGDYRKDYYLDHWKNFARGRYLAKRLAGKKPDGKFLDVGCSIGSFMEGFQNESGWQGEGCELDPTAVEECVSRGLKAHHGLIYDLSFDKNSFDVIIANNVLEHDPDPERFLLKLESLLKKGGVLYLTTPNGVVDVAPSLKLASKGIKTTTSHAGHINYFSRSGLGSLVNRAGFDVKRFSSFHFTRALKYTAFFFTREKKWLRNANKRLEKPEKIDPTKVFEIPERDGDFSHQFALFKRALFMAPSWCKGADFELELTRN